MKIDYLSEIVTWLTYLVIGSILYFAYTLQDLINIPVWMYKVSLIVAIIHLPLYVYAIIIHRKKEKPKKIVYIKKYGINK